MASDEIVWSVINQQFCSFKLKTTKDRTFCRNEYNVTGLCTRQSCPLANSRYATVRSNPETGQIYLFVKTIERSHMPNRWWQKIKLSKDYATALEQIDSQLIYWPKFLIHKCKQRLTRLHQVAIRTKRLLKEQERLGETLVPKLAPKIRRREETRERKAESAAKLERSIERVLMERLVNGTYGENPLNVEENVWRKVMKSLEKSGKGTQDVDLDDEEIEEEQEVELENEPDVEYVSDLEESDADLQDLEDWIGSGDEEVEDEDEDEESDEEGDSEEVSDEGEEGDDAEDEIAALKKAISGLKRKRAPEPTPDTKAKKDKKSRGRDKGPKREIEYEIEREPAVRQTLHA